MITINPNEVQAEADRCLHTEPATVTVEAVRSWWEVKAGDPDDDPIIVTTEIPNGDSLEIQIVVPHGWSYLSPARAKALAYVLLCAADEAETARIVGGAA